jgi:RNA polymerase sigma factor (sigma-70 family)
VRYRLTPRSRSGVLLAHPRCNGSGGLRVYVVMGNGGSTSERDVDQSAASWPTELVDEYAERKEALVRLATAMLGSAAEAEEIVQDAFIATAGRWSEVRAVRPYLRAAVVNRANGVHRRRRTAERHHVDEPPPDAPRQLVEFRDVLLALPVRQRAVLVMRFVEDLPDSEIALALGCRPATVRSLAARGLAQIRKELT